MTNSINFNTNPVRFTHPLFTLSMTVYALKKYVISACFAQPLLKSMFETHLSVSQSLLRMSSKTGCPCRKCRNVWQADRATSTEGGSIVISSACSLSASTSHSAEVDLAEIMSLTMLSSVTQIGMLSTTHNVLPWWRYCRWVWWVAFLSSRGSSFVVVSV